MISHEFERLTKQGLTNTENDLCHSLLEQSYDLQYIDPKYFPERLHKYIDALNKNAGKIAQVRKTLLDKVIDIKKGQLKKALIKQLE